MKVTDVSVKLKTFPLTWSESSTSWTTQTSFGLVHISKLNKEVTVHSISSTNQILKHTKDFKKLKQLVEEFHILQINKIHQLWTKTEVEIK